MEGSRLLNRDLQKIRGNNALSPHPLRNHGFDARRCRHTCLMKDDEAMKTTFYDGLFDVVIAGGGVSGCAAAVAAARSGAGVLVLERAACLGGTLTTCGVGPMMTFHAGDRQVIKGIMQEIVDRLVRRGFSPGHVPDTKQYVATITPFDAEGLKLILDEMLAEAGCGVLFHTFMGAVRRDGDHIESVTVCNKDGLRPVSGKVFVDATGDGDLAAWAGLPMTKGRPEDGAAQPMTMKMKYCDVDTAALKKHVLDNLDRFPKMKPFADIFRRDIPIDLEGFDEEFRAAKKTEGLSVERENVLLFGTGRPGEYIINTTRVTLHDGTDAASLSEAERIGRRQCSELAAFLRRHVPGFANALLEYTGPAIGIRGSRQLVGHYTLTADDILTKRAFPGVVVHSGYPIDIHSPTGEGTSSSFLSSLADYYSIPYDIMFSDEVKNLLVSGRCASATFEAQAAFRTTPTCGALGQAAGIAAAMAAASDGDVRHIDVSALQTALKRQGAYLEI